MASRALKIDSKRAATSHSEVQPGRSAPIEGAAIAARAYEYWQQRGCPVGSDQEDWFRAEQELKQVGQRPMAA